jgi:hypothetical protein
MSAQLEDIPKSPIAQTLVPVGWRDHVDIWGRQAVSRVWPKQVRLALFSLRVCPIAVFIQR